MFFSAPPVVDFVDLKDDQLVFLSPKPLRLGRDNSVKLALRASQAQKGLMPLKVTVNQARTVESGQVAYVATLQSELPFQPETVEGLEDAALRRGERLDCHLRIMSPDLPSYSAVSVDFSLSGLQIETHSPTNPGQIVRLRLETHIAELETIQVSARIAWSRPEGRKRFRAGLEFYNVAPEVRHQLEELTRYLKLREEANLTQKVLECADRYLLGYATEEVAPAE